MKYIFLHIPKNGGTTLDHILDAQYKKHTVFNIAERNRDQKLLELKSKNYIAKKLIKVIKGGHFSYGVHEHFPKSETIKYCTILRDPVRRAISYYYFAKAEPEHYLHKLVNDVTIEEFLNRDDLTFEIRNGQTKLIAGLDQDQECTEEVYKKAKENLENDFFQVGILKYYLETLYLLKEQLNWKKPIPYIIRNVNKHKKDDVSDVIKEKIIQLNSFDIEIYNTYKRQLEEQIKNIDPKAFEAFKSELI